MRKMLRLAALTGVMACLAWLSPTPRAEAFPYPPCQTLNNTACPAVGQSTFCQSTSGQVFTCWCFNAGSQTIWSCPVPPAGP
jgi:hypothetical protein